MCLKQKILSALDNRQFGGLVHRVAGNVLRRWPRLAGFTNPLYVSHLVVRRSGAQYVVSGESYLARRVPNHEMVIFDGSAYEPEISHLIDSLIGPDDVALDIGANVGIHTVAMAHKASRGHVYAFEPVTEMAERNSINCALNGLSNVTILGYGLGAEAGDYDMHVNIAETGLEGTSSFLKTVHVANRPEQYETRRLSVRRLDDVIRSLAPVGRIGFIKIDTEGYEPSVLEGARETIRSHRPAMVVEAHSTRLAQLGKSFAWYRETFPDYHVLMIPAVSPANPYLRLIPLTEEPPEIAINLLLLPRMAIRAPE